jgi:hypothetical protein
MGILDDAIRQHLDLKRRQGADDDELKRLEDEAFGPPSRPGDAEFAEAGGEEALAPEGVAVEERPPEREPADAEPESDGEAEPAPAAESDADAALFDHQEEASLDLDLDLEEDEVTPAPPSAGESPIESLDTVEHPFEDEEQAAAGAGEEAADEVIEGEVIEGEVVDDEPAGEPGEAEPTAEDEDDVLEETPEFLRDAPEDDELWFEQGKPKDFDF